MALELQYGMRCLALLLLTAVIFWRFYGWKRSQKDAEAVKSYLETARMIGKAFLVFKGEPALLPNGRSQLVHPEVRTDHGWIPFAGKVELVDFSQGLNSERKVEVSGHFSNTPSYRNPGVAADGLWVFHQAKLWGPTKRATARLLAERVSFSVRFHREAVQFVQERLRRFLGLSSLCHAVWFGSVDALPESIQRFYQQGGLLPILALSGQHVAVLVLLLELAFSFFLWLLPSLLTPRWLRWLYREVQKALPVLCGFLLYMTSLGGPAIQRTCVMGVAWYLLRSFRLYPTSVQWVSSSIAGLMLWDPALVASAGFSLSAGATLFMASVFYEANLKRRLVRYLGVCIVMPFLVSPLSAFLFGKVAWSAPFFSVVLTGFWDLFWIPLGFILPLLLLSIPEEGLNWLLPALENAWQLFLRGHSPLRRWAEWGYQSTLRPTWIELLLLEVLFCLLACWTLERWFCRSEG